MGESLIEIKPKVTEDKDFGILVYRLKKVFRGVVTLPTQEPVERYQS